MAHNGWTNTILRVIGRRNTIYPLAVSAYILLGGVLVRYSPARLVAGACSWTHWTEVMSPFYSLTDAVLGTIVVVVKGTVL